MDILIILNFITSILTLLINVFQSVKSNHFESTCGNNNCCEIDMERTFNN